MIRFTSRPAILPASFVASAKLMEPVFAAVWGLILFQERPAALVVAGGVVVILGIALYSRIAGREEGGERLGS